MCWTEVSHEVTQMRHCESGVGGQQSDIPWPWHSSYNCNPRLAWSSCCRKGRGSGRVSAPKAQLLHNPWGLASGDPPSFWSFFCVSSSFFFCPLPTQLWAFPAPKVNIETPDVSRDILKTCQDIRRGWGALGRPQGDSWSWPGASEFAVVWWVFQMEVALRLPRQFKPPCKAIKENWWQWLPWERNLGHWEQRDCIFIVCTASISFFLLCICIYFSKNEKQIFILMKTVFFIKMYLKNPLHCNKSICSSKPGAGGRAEIIIFFFSFLIKKNFF